MKNLLMMLLLTFLYFKVTAQQEGNFPPPEEQVTISALPTEGGIKVDGKLDEPDWQRAESITDFFRMEPRQG